MYPFPPLPPCYDWGSMKRFFCVLAAVGLFPALTLSLPVPKKVSAAETVRYAVAATSDVWFYARADESSRLFQLPYTYYVRVTGEGDPFVPAEYLEDEGPYRKLSGFCRREALTFVDFVPERPFLFRELTLRYSLPQQTLLGGGKFSEAERTVVFYGRREEGGQLYYYVGADGMFDYVPAEAELTYELNTDYLQSAAGGGETQSGLSGAAIAAICAACVAAVGAAVFVIRGKKPVQPEAEHDF